MMILLEDWVLILIRCSSHPFGLKSHCTATTRRSSRIGTEMRLLEACSLGTGDFCVARGV